MNELDEMDYPEPPPEELETEITPIEEPTPSELERARSLFDSLDPEQQAQIIGTIRETHGGVRNLLDLMTPHDNEKDPLMETVEVLLLAVRQLRESQIIESSKAEKDRKLMRKVLIEIGSKIQHL